MDWRFHEPDLRHGNAQDISSRGREVGSEAGRQGDVALGWIRREFMALELKQQLRLSQQLVMTPQLQQAIKLLQLNQLELVNLVQQELQENPVLEEADVEEETEGEREDASPEEYDQLDSEGAGADADSSDSSAESEFKTALDIQVEAAQSSNEETATGGRRPAERCRDDCRHRMGILPR